MSYAHGPARVPEKDELPPVGWGSRISSWDERVRQWRRRPAKERRGCSLPRQRHDPTMPKVSEGPYGTIRWSNGHGVWAQNYNEVLCGKQGYWLKVDTCSLSRKVKFIGPSMKEVHEYLKGYVHREQCAALIQISRAKQAMALGMADLDKFDQVLRTRVLDMIVAELDNE